MANCGKYRVQIDISFDSVVIPATHDFDNFHDALKFYHEKVSVYGHMYDITLYKIISQSKTYENNL